MTSSMIHQEISIFREISMNNPKYLDVKTPTISMIRKNLAVEFVSEPLNTINIANQSTKPINYADLLVIVRNRNNEIKIAN